MKYSVFENSCLLDSFLIPYYNNNSEHLKELHHIFSDVPVIFSLFFPGLFQMVFLNRCSSSILLTEIHSSTSIIPRQEFGETIQS